MNAIREYDDGVKVLQTDPSLERLGFEWEEFNAISKEAKKNLDRVTEAIKKELLGRKLLRVHVPGYRFIASVSTDSMTIDWAKANALEPGLQDRLTGKYGKKRKGFVRLTITPK